MSLNIKNEETHRLASELAKLTGETMTEAVTKAVEERLERERKRQRRATAEEILAIGRRCAAGLRGTPIDHAELLYDEHGLPK